MQNTLRVDLYGPIHKALRARLFDLGVELDRCDYSKSLEVAVCSGVYHRTINFIREHHHHEDTFIEPALLPEGPIVQEVARQHAVVNAAMEELDQLVAALDKGKGDQRAVGAALCAGYRRFLICYLDHMQHEETVVNASLWRRYTDDELMALRGRLQGSIPPARFGEWLEILLPALNHDERTGVLKGIKAAAPPPAFAAATAIASRVLGPAAWSAVREQLDVAGAP